MSDDATLIAALRKCEHCGGKGYTETENHTSAMWRCPHCRLARMAADRIESKQRAFVAAYEDLCNVAERVRERCVSACERAYLDEGKPTGTAAMCMDDIRALTVEDLLKP